MHDRATSLRSLETLTDSAERPALTNVRSVRDRWMTVLVALISVGVALLGVSNLWPQRVEEVVAAPQPPVAVPRPVHRAAPAREFAASGHIVARQIATIAAQTPGRVERVLVQEGMEVEAGAVLAELDGTPAITDLEIARAQLNAAVAQARSRTEELQEAQRKLEQMERLAVSGLLSADALALARSRAAVSKSDAQQVAALLKAAELEVRHRAETLALHTIRAPFRGVIGSLSAQPGEVVSPLVTVGGAARNGICTLIDTGSIEAQVEVNESNLHKVHLDQPVRAVLDAYPDWKLHGMVRAIMPMADRQKGTVMVRISLQNMDARVLPGMGVKTHFIEQHLQAGIH